MSEIGSVLELWRQTREIAVRHSQHGQLGPRVWPGTGAETRVQQRGQAHTCTSDQGQRL